MKRYFIGITLVIFMLFIGLFYSLPRAIIQYRAGSFQGQNVSAVSLNEFEEYLNSERDTELLDIRSKDEFNKQHIDGATLLETEWIDTLGSQLKMMDLQKTYLVYSNSGERSYNMTQRMRVLGFSSIVELEGGLDAWTMSGKPVVTEQL